MKEGSRERMKEIKKVEREGGERRGEIEKDERDIKEKVDRYIE